MELDLQSLFRLHVTWCAQLFSLAESPQPSPSPAFGLIYEGRYWSAKIDDISLQHNFRLINSHVKLPLHIFFPVQFRKRITRWFKYLESLFYRDSVTRFFASGFLHESVSPQPQSIPLGPFRVFFENSRRYSQVKVTAGINDTGGKFCHQFH